MAYGKGDGFFGTNSIKTTTQTMQEVLDFTKIQESPKYRYKKSFYRFDFDNKQDCTVFINGDKDGIFLEAGNGWRSDMQDAEIKSFKVKESGISYKWVGHY